MIKGGNLPNPAFQALVEIEASSGGYAWSVKAPLQPTADRSEGGWETTRLKAWRKACAVARRDFGPVR